MPTPREILLALILPAVIAAVSVLATWRGPLRGRCWPFTLGLLIAYVVGYLGFWEPPPFPPIDTSQWIFFLPIGATAIGLLAALPRWPQPMTNLLGLLLYFTFILALMRPILDTITFAQGAEVVTLLAFSGLSSFVSLNHLAHRGQSASVHLILLLITAATAQVIMLSYTAYIGRTALVVTAALAASLPLVWWLSLSWRNGPTLLVVSLWHAFLIVGFFFAQLTPLNAMLLAVAPHLAWLAEGPRAKTLPLVPRLMLRFGAPMVPVFAAQILSLQEYLQTMRANQF